MRRRSSARRWSRACDRVCHAQRLLHRVLAAADQAEAADHLDGVALDEVVAADVGVAVGDGVLQLLQRDAVLLAAGPGRAGSRSA